MRLPKRPLLRIKYEPSEVLYLSAASEYSFIHLLDGPKILVSYTLAQLTHAFPGYLRVHKSTLINPAYVQLIHRWNHNGPCGEVVLTNGERLGIAKRRINQLTKP